MSFSEYASNFETFSSILGGLDKMAKSRQKACFIYKLFTILCANLLFSQ